MVDNNADYTNTFRSLSQLEKPNSELYKGKSFKIGISVGRIDYEKTQSQLSLVLINESRNPAVIPRNHKVEEALESAIIGNLKPFEDLV